MTVCVPIPGCNDLRLDHVILDVNGTLTNRGVLLADVVCASAADALDLLLDPKALAATLRP